MTRLFLAILGLLWAGSAFATCTNTVTVKDGAGATQTFCRGTDSTNMISAVNILDSAGTNFASVTAANALKTQDASDMSGTTPGTAPGNTLIAGGIFNSVLPAPTTGQTLPLQLDASGRVIVSLGTSLATGTNTIGKVDILGNAGAILDGVIGAATAPANMLAVGGVFNSSPLTLTNGQSSALQLDASGFLKVSGLAQGSTTSGQSGSLVMGAVTTSPPSDTTAQTNPLSLDLNGGLRVSPVCNKVINVAQTATTDVHTFTGFGYICSIMLVSATAQSIGIDEGTGTTCETSGTALIGVSNTATATSQVALAANGGFSMVSGVPLMRTQVSADHLCVLQSSTGEVAGTITYADLTN